MGDISTGLIVSSGMGTVLRDLAELGYGCAWRILDAQYFGVAQRRRRVFVVGCLGDWRRAAEVLFEPESLPWNPPPSREARQRTAACHTRVTESRGRGGYAGRRREDDENLICGSLAAHSERHGHAMTTQQAAESNQLVAMCLNGKNGNRYDGESETMVVAAPITAGYAKGSVKRKHASEEQHGVAFQCQESLGVRRLMPIECERLQGFPDDWTRYGHDEKEISDSARYRMIGNAVAVPVVEWIGRRILNSA